MYNVPIVDVGKNGEQKMVHWGTCKMTAPVTRTTLRTSGPLRWQTLGGERHRYTVIVGPDKFGIDVTAVDGMDKRVAKSGRKQRKPRVSTRLNLGGESERADARRDG